MPLGKGYTSALNTRASYKGRGAEQGPRGQDTAGGYLGS
jgi:hypothetical protein